MVSEIETQIDKSELTLKQAGIVETKEMVESTDKDNLSIITFSKWFNIIIIV